MDGWRKEVDQEAEAEDRELRELTRQDCQVCAPGRWRAVRVGGSFLCVYAFQTILDWHQHFALLLRLVSLTVERVGDDQPMTPSNK